ncbi:MAG: FAD-dependent oxidoreductase [Candidatus Woesearchaeota archaeon]
MYDTIIIGAGIAGCTAAIYASRKKMDYLLITDKFGGQFFESGEVLNYPGIQLTTGAEFAGIMEKQLKFNKVKLNEGELVKEIKKSGKNCYKVVTDKNKYLTKTIIIATGARARQLKVPGEQEFKNKGLTYCAVCDGPLFQGKDVAVIGGGDSAAEAVDFMLNIAKKVYLIVRGSNLTAHEYLQERLKQHKKVEILFNADTKEIIGDRFVSGIRLYHKGKKKEIKVKGVIVEIGRIPNTDFLKGFVKFDEHNHVLVDHWCYTSKPGIFSAGDCCSVHEYQYVIAAGQGCIALLKAARYLSKFKEE